MSLKEKIIERANKKADCKFVPPEVTEIEYNEKGQIKRNGYRQGSSVYYGKEFEEENFDRVFKMGIIGIIGMFVIFGLLIVAVIYLAMSGNFRPFLMDVIN